MTYILSDIHGNERRFRSVLKQIRLRPEDTLYVLGDVIDRHTGGIRILRRMMNMPNAKMLLGNHEYMMLRALGFPKDRTVDDVRATAHWYRTGGKVPHDHLKHLRKSLRQEIVDYLTGLPLHYDLEVNGRHYKLVHAAPEELYAPEPLYPTPIHYAVWKRLDPDAALPGDYTLVFGHSTTSHYQDAVPMELSYGHRRIGIDCGSGHPEGSAGRLACLRLEDGAVFYSEEDVK